MTESQIIKYIKGEINHARDWHKHKLKVKDALRKMKQKREDEFFGNILKNYDKLQSWEIEQAMQSFVMGDR